MARSLSNRQKERIVLSFIAIVICYNAHEIIPLFYPDNYFIGFPFFTDHKEPIAWYVKDIGFRIAIAIFSALLLYLEHNRLNLGFTMLLRATTGFLVKDILDYILCYDQFPVIWDILFYMGIIIYVLFAPKEWKPKGYGFSN